MFTAPRQIFLKVYGASSDVTATVAAQASGHDRIMMTAFAWNAARARVTRSNLYFYEFGHVLPGPSGQNWGAFHSSEIVDVLRTLGGLDRPFTALDRKVSEQLSGYWVNFIKTGNPNGAGLPMWPAFAPETRLVMGLGEKSSVHAVAPTTELSFLAGALGVPSTEHAGIQ